MNNIPENAIKVFKYVTEDFLSPGDYGKLDYSGPYPKTIIESNYAPKEEGQCAAGIHVIPMTNDIDWTNAIFSDNIIVGYAMPEDVIFSEGKGKMRVKQFTVTHTPAREEIIPFILQHSKTSVQYALNIDKEPRDDTRAVACTNSHCAHRYALKVDKVPRDDTRTAACKDTYCAYKYALNIDKEARDETRTAACKDAHYAFFYALNVDKSPTKETWEAVQGSEYQSNYLQHFNTTEEELESKFATEISQETNNE